MWEPSQKIVGYQTLPKWSNIQYSISSIINLITTKVFSCNWTAQWRGLPVAAESCAASAASSLMWTEIGVGWILWNRGMGWQKYGNEMKQLAIYTLHLQKVAVDVSSSSGLVDSEKRSQSTCEPNGHSMEYMRHSCFWSVEPIYRWVRMKDMFLTTVKS